MNISRLFLQYFIHHLELPLFFLFMLPASVMWYKYKRRYSNVTRIAIFLSSNHINHRKFFPSCLQRCSTRRNTKRRVDGESKKDRLIKYAKFLVFEKGKKEKTEGRGLRNGTMKRKNKRSADSNIR